MVGTMPLSRTRSLLSNINGAESIVDENSVNANHLPPLANGSRSKYAADFDVDTVKNGGDVISNTLVNGLSGTLPVIRSSSITDNSNGELDGSPKPKAIAASPDQVAKLYGNKLTPYEQLEIYDYPQIYFIGGSAKKRQGLLGSPNNCGYDDENGSYQHVCHDHIAYRYEVLKVIGKGSFGQVVKAYDHKNHVHVALKMVRNEKR